MTSKDFDRITRKLGLNQGEAAHYLSLSLRSVHGYCNGTRVPKRVAVQLRYFEKYGLGLADLLLK